MVNGLHLYSAFYPKRFTIYASHSPIHPFSHTNGNWLPCKVPTSSRSNWGLGALLRDTPTHPGGDRTGNPPTARRLLLPPEPYRFVGKHRGQTFGSFPAGLHRSLQILSKSLRFRGCRLATRSFSSLHRDWLGHSRPLICFFLSHSFVALPHVLGHCHVGRPIHDPFSVLSLREGGCRPKCPVTWPHSSSPRYGEVVLSP